MKQDPSQYHRPKDMFNPSFAFKNGHFQTVVNGFRLRHLLVRYRAKTLLRRVESHIIDCGEGIRLQGFFSGHAEPADRLVILIHGWAGDADSSYLLSAAAFLWQRGFDIFRINLRDHGNTYHLNRGVFHSCRINEVVEAVRWIQQAFPRKQTFLAGFSLGGNFALRTGVLAPSAGARIDGIAAVCPVLDPDNTLTALESGWWLYHWYYLKNWQRSLIAKHRYFPDLEGLEHAGSFTGLREMTEYFVSRFTHYPTLKDYLNGYTITGDYLATLSIPSLIIASADDPVIPVIDFSRIDSNRLLEVEIHPHGGHCAFFNDWRLNSIVEPRLAERFENRR